MQEMKLREFAARSGPIRSAGGAIPKGNCPFLFLRSFVKTVEWWNGIGGEMAGARKKQAAVGKLRGTGARKQAGGSGAAKVRQAADKAMMRNFEGLARSLMQLTLGGNTSCAKLLFELADGQVRMEDEGTMRRFRSLAEEWAAEPTWEGEVVDAGAGTECGQGEGEG
jgi:streptomycin 6-kinase